MNEKNLNYKVTCKTEGECPLNSLIRGLVNNERLCSYANESCPYAERKYDDCNNK